ncbi:hypothetical protein [Arthrobacter sp. efr-133-R2A-63]|uniref:hypothetical protein n=1 Tax=Arthrobacter sp. efr-133-R2A-63 TaxID=3040278 RepID=UPI00254BE4C2|nr:hypothetical protein [Arthrobacter sp. efr-133-R2A-63]
MSPRRTLINRLIEPTSGTIYLDDQPTSTMDAVLLRSHRDGRGAAASWKAAVTRRGSRIPVASRILELSMLSYGLPTTTGVP